MLGMKFSRAERSRWLRPSVLVLVVALVSVGFATSALAARLSPGGDVPGAVVIERLPFETVLSTVALPDATNGADCAGAGHAAWFAYTPHRTMDVVASTAGSDYDTTLSAYSFVNGQLSQLACNDDFGSLQSQVQFSAPAGQTVYLMAASFSGSPGGNLRLDLTDAGRSGTTDPGCVQRSSRAASGRCGPPTTYYLALGDSVPVWNGPDSYPDQILRSPVTRSVHGIKLVNLACSSETSDTFIGASLCGGSQLDRAAQFLRDNRGHVAMLTIDIGGNDVLPCASLSGIDWDCGLAVFDHLRTNLRTILGTLRDAAGPGVPFFSMNYYNPFLGYDLVGPAVRPLIIGTVFGQQLLNQTIEQVYAEYGVPVADVSSAFHSTDLTTIVPSQWGDIPLAVERACTLLDIGCHAGGLEDFGDDPNVQGATLIAHEFESLIGHIRRPSMHRA